MASTQRINEKTPNGGAYSIAYFLDANGKSVDKTQAKKVEIVEFTKDGKEIQRTYGSFDSEEQHG